MKKIALMMVGVLALGLTTACNDTDSDYASDAAYGRVINTVPVTIQTDDNQQLVVADATPIGGSYAPDYGQRVLIYYKKHESAEGGAQSNKIKLFGYYHFEAADSECVDTAADITFGDKDVDIYQSYGQYYLVHVTKEVVDIALLFPSTQSGMKNHTFTLVLDRENPVSEDNYLQLTICHETTESEASTTNLAANFYTFDMTPFASYVENVAGVRFTAAGIQSKNPVSHQITWAK